MAKKKKTRRINVRKLMLFLLPAFFGFLSLFVYFNSKNALLSVRCCLPESFSGEIEYTATEGVYNGKSVYVPQLAFLKDEKAPVLGVSNSEKWIEVDLSDQKLIAWEGANKFLETLVSTGLPYFPTPKGEFNIWIKLRAARMKGGSGRYAYNLPNVPYIMYFEGSGVPSYKGYGLHGAYWHNDFGRVHSHGCVNLPIEAAKNLYFWTSPVVPEGTNMLRASAENPGTRIVIHE